MKIIELNIGLSSKTQGTHNPIAVLNSLTGRGFTLITYRVQESTCKDGIEKCLAVKCECPADWQDQLSSLSNHLGQDCIAVVGFIGPSPYDAFVPSLWVEPTEATVSDAEKFIAYLQGTLIPDLKESGYEATADDFESLIEFYRNK